MAHGKASKQLFVHIDKAPSCVKRITLVDVKHQHHAVVGFWSIVANCDQNCDKSLLSH